MFGCLLYFCCDKSFNFSHTHHDIYVCLSAKKLYCPLTEINHDSLTHSLIFSVCLSTLQLYYTLVGTTSARCWNLPSEDFLLSSKNNFLAMISISLSCFRMQWMMAPTLLYLRVFRLPPPPPAAATATVGAMEGVVEGRLKRILGCCFVTMANLFHRWMCWDWRVWVSPRRAPKTRRK